MLPANGKLRQEECSVKKPQIIFKYLFAEDYNPVYVNGAHGGVSPRGELVVHFYLERSGIPVAITQEINANGTIGAVIDEVPADFNQTLYRAVESGIVLNYESARTIHGWLGERIKELEALQQAKESMQFTGADPAKDITH
ncbi:hypothetical protein KI809_06015 [Geobacter pelophilus]|uniref:Uncharacterized protein n=1 Tax=Geoanaerobacter pelophilus TaxID=60036 RepID=A0AAW4KZ64_9BACT|nr:hypothetical protein [Geoanaerobacter pelophilus]MBT0663853.1 hypothetical protein [Geoanaerobacter pelophilus]